MNKHFSSPDITDEADKTMNRSDVNSDRFVDNVPVLAGLIHDTPTGGVVAADGPLDETVAHKAPTSEGGPYFDFALAAELVAQQTPSGTNSASLVTPLLDHEDSEHLRTRWNEIQGRFVDEPRSAVQQADTLVSEVIKKITEMFANEHGSLEGQWKQGDNVSTEDLRQALQHYRSFFNRLVV
jgi:hypothetical protein